VDRPDFILLVHRSLFVASTSPSFAPACGSVCEGKTQTCRKQQVVFLLSRRRIADIDIAERVLPAQPFVVSRSPFFKVTWTASAGIAPATKKRLLRIAFAQVLRQRLKNKI
jgi:hypothetical protein